MVLNSMSLEGTVEEYEAVVDRHAQTNVQSSSLDWDTIVDKLESELGWTHEGACAVAGLARSYGAFMLRNALALAKVLGVEDGELGY